MAKDIKVKEIELDKNLKSLIDKGLVKKVGSGYQLTPLGAKVFRETSGGVKLNKKGGKIKKDKKLKKGGKIK